MNKKWIKINDKSKSKQNSILNIYEKYNQRNKIGSVEIKLKYKRKYD